MLAFNSNSGMAGKLATQLSTRQSTQKRATDSAINPRTERNWNEMFVAAAGCVFMWSGGQPDFTPSPFYPSLNDATATLGCQLRHETRRALTGRPAIAKIAKLVGNQLSRELRLVIATAAFHFSLSSARSTITTEHRLNRMGKLIMQSGAVSWLSQPNGIDLH